jgi:CheY-like chemotaxis protein
MRDSANPSFAAVSNPKATVLVVEDDVLQRMFLADEMRRAGYNVLEAASAHEAIAILGAGARVDLMITDIDMPGAMDGLALASFVRNEHSTILVVIASGHSAHLRQQSTPVHAIFTKPYDFSAMAAAVRRLIGEEQTAPAPAGGRERDR